MSTARRQTPLCCNGRACAPSRCHLSPSRSSSSARANCICKFIQGTPRKCFRKLRGWSRLTPSAWWSKFRQRLPALHGDCTIGCSGDTRDHDCRLYGGANHPRPERRCALLRCRIPRSHARRRTGCTLTGRANAVLAERAACANRNPGCQRPHTGRSGASRGDGYQCGHAAACRATAIAGTATNDGSVCGVQRSHPVATMRKPPCRTRQ